MMTGQELIHEKENAWTEFLRDLEELTKARSGRIDWERVECRKTQASQSAAIYTALATRYHTP